MNNTRRHERVFNLEIAAHTVGTEHVKALRDDDRLVTVGTDAAANAMFAQFQFCFQRFINGGGRGQQVGTLASTLQLDVVLLHTSKTTT